MPNLIGGFLAMLYIAPAISGQGMSIEPDVCDMRYFLYGDSYVDTCAPGVTCVFINPPHLRYEGDISGACCDDTHLTMETTYGSWGNAGTGTQQRTNTYYPCTTMPFPYTEYRCASGYYGEPTRASGDCTACPANATCNAGATTFSCNKGYYKSGNACAACPSGGTTSGTGATSVTQCCIPAGTAFSDSAGSGTYTSQCCAS